MKSTTQYKHDYTGYSVFGNIEHSNEHRTFENKDEKKKK